MFGLDKRSEQELKRRKQEEYRRQLDQAAATNPRSNSKLRGGRQEPQEPSRDPYVSPHRQQRQPDWEESRMQPMPAANPYASAPVGYAAAPPLSVRTQQNYVEEEKARRRQSQDEYRRQLDMQKAAPVDPREQRYPHPDARQMQDDARIRAQLERDMEIEREERRRALDPYVPVRRAEVPPAVQDSMLRKQTQDAYRMQLDNDMMMAQRGLPERMQPAYGQYDREPPREVHREMPRDLPRERDLRNPARDEGANKRSIQEQYRRQLDMDQAAKQPVRERRDEYHPTMPAQQQPPIAAPTGPWVDERRTVNKDAYRRQLDEQVAHKAQEAAREERARMTERDMQTAAPLAEARGGRRPADHVAEDNLRRRQAQEKYRRELDEQNLLLGKNVDPEKDGRRSRTPAKIHPAPQQEAQQPTQPVPQQVQQQPVRFEEDRYDDRSDRYSEPAYGGYVPSIGQDRRPAEQNKNRDPYDMSEEEVEAAIAAMKRDREQRESAVRQSHDHYPSDRQDRYPAQDEYVERPPPRAEPSANQPPPMSPSKSPHAARDRLKTDIYGKSDFLVQGARQDDAWRPGGKNMSERERNAIEQQKLINKQQIEDNAARKQKEKDDEKKRIEKEREMERKEKAEEEKEKKAAHDKKVALLEQQNRDDAEKRSKAEMEALARKNRHVDRTPVQASQPVQQQQQQPAQDKSAYRSNVGMVSDEVVSSPMRDELNAYDERRSHQQPPPNAYDERRSHQQPPPNAYAHQAQDGYGNMHTPQGLSSADSVDRFVKGYQQKNTRPRDYEEEDRYDRIYQQQPRHPRDWERERDYRDHDPRMRDYRDSDPRTRDSRDTRGSHDDNHNLSLVGDTRFLANNLWQPSGLLASLVPLGTKEDRDVAMGRRPPRTQTQVDNLEKSIASDSQLIYLGGRTPAGSQFDHDNSMQPPKVSPSMHCCCSADHL